MSALTAGSRTSLSPLALYPRYSELAGRVSGRWLLCPWAGLLGVAAP